VAYSSKDTKKIYEKAVEEKRESIRRIKSSIPRAVSKYVDRMLSKDKEKRPSNMESVIKEIRMLLLDKSCLTPESRKANQGILKESAIFFKDLKERVTNLLF